MSPEGMRSLFVVIFTCTFAHAAPGALAGVEAEQQALFDAVSPSVVFIATANGFGSGFFVGDDGLVLTSAHVVGGHDGVKVVLADGRRVEGRVIERAAG